MINEEALGRRLRRAVEQTHRLTNRGAFVKQAGVRHWQAGEIADHRLKVQQRLKAALANFRLVWRVRGVPPWIFKYATTNHRWGHGAAVPQADHGNQYGIS